MAWSGFTGDALIVVIRFPAKPILCIVTPAGAIWWLCLDAIYRYDAGNYQMRVHQLQEQEKKFREAVETMPALAFVADPKGSRTFLNRGWLEYTGLSAEQASGSGWEKAIHPDDLKRITERWCASQTTGQSLDYEARPSARIGRRLSLVPDPRPASAR